MIFPSKKRRIVFMGSPEFAVPALEALIKERYDIACVITVADKPAGRGRKLKESAVKQCARKHKLNILQPVNLKDARFISSLEALNADLFIVVAFRMLPEDVWSIPPFGTFNLHASLLPKYRGAAPIHWAIINGETKSGLTTFLLDQKIDTGGTLLQVEHNIEPGSTTGRLYNELMELGPELVLRTAKGIFDGSLKPISQDDNEASYAPKLNRNNTILDLSKKPRELVQQILGLNPSPKAHYGDFNFLLSGETKQQCPKEKPVLCVREGRLFLDYSLGSVEIFEIQPSGKKIMHAKSFLNGLKVAVLPL